MALDLARFTGSERWFRHWSSPTIIYSEGMRHLAEEAAASWLIDAIASHLTSSPDLIAEREQNAAFDGLHFWYLTRNEDDRRAVLEARLDVNEPAVVRQEIDFTDFPFDRVGGSPFTIYAGTDGPGTPTKLFLPSEY